MVPLPGGGARPSGGDGCARWHARVSEYVDGTLDAGVRERMERHLAACATCRGEVELETRLRAQMRADTLVLPPLALSDRLMSIGADSSATAWLAADGPASLPSRRGRRQRLTAVSLGTVLVVVSLVLGVGWTLAPTLPRANSVRGMAIEQATAAVPSSASTDPSDCPAMFTCPAQLAGLPLVAVTASGDAVLLLYAAGGSVVAVAEEWGVLDDEGPSARDVTVPSLAWQNGDTCYAVSASSLLLATTAEGELPHAPVPGQSLAERVSRGLKRLAGR